MFLVHRGNCRAYLGGRFGYFFIFFRSGRGKGGVRGAGRGIVFLLKIPGGGSPGREGPRAGRVSCGELGDFGRGGGG